MGVDLHVHSTASDGEWAPAPVVRAAADAGITTLALTDHDTLAGLAEASVAAVEVGVRLIRGCEFSVRTWFGEMHLLGYCLPDNHPPLDEFLETQREMRLARAQAMVDRLGEIGQPLSLDQVRDHAQGDAVGRPHVARALVAAGRVGTVNEAFDRFLADGGPAFVPKVLPDLEAVTALVREGGGVTSAAHLRERATRRTVVRLRDHGVDGIEVLHPSHTDEVAARLQGWATDLEMVMTGGSDWHGPGQIGPSRRVLGSQNVPGSWVEAIEARHALHLNGAR